MADAPLPVYLVRGDDPVLAADAVRALVLELVGGADPTLAVDDLADDDYELAAVVDAAQTPPFLVDRRVVVARGIGRFRADELGPLLAYLADPLATTSLVLVGGGPLSQKVANAVKKVGRVVEAGAPRGRQRRAWLTAEARSSGVRLDAAAVDALDEHLGEDVGRLTSVLGMLASAYDEGATLGPGQVAPFLGEAGAVAPWELTDAIDRGDTAAALEALHRLLGAGDRHPLVVLATLHNHYARILRLDGADAGDEATAAALLGMTGSTYPAKKALAQARRLGHERVARALGLLADADLALKGATEWPGELVLEVLVARLSRLGPRATRSETRRG